MEPKDKQITCVECGELFTFTVSEQNFYREKGFVNEPKRCKPCRDKRKKMGEGRAQGRGHQRW